MSNKTYKFDIYGKVIIVKSDEVRNFYPKEHTLTEKEINDYAARYMAQIKFYRECKKVFNKELAQRLLLEEKLMKENESDGFLLQFRFSWFVEFKKETNADLKYTLNAYCLDNLQTFSRRYTSLEKALLHCLNRFNENVFVIDKYKSIEDYFLKPYKYEQGET